MSSNFSVIHITALSLSFFAIAPLSANAGVNKTTISPSGYHGLTFGQEIDKRALTKVGLSYPKDVNPYCYYVPIVKNKTPSPILLQVVNNRFGLVSVKDKSVSLFSKSKVGDTVQTVLKANRGLPVYNVDKYDNGTGNQYHLIYTFPNKNQLKYSFSGGVKMPFASIQAKDWNQDLKNGLKGKLQSISVGTPSAIALVEGCS